MTDSDAGKKVVRMSTERLLCTWKQPLKDTKLSNRIIKLRILVFAILALVLVLLAYFYGASPI
jgi:hypothetical protein